MKFDRNRIITAFNVDEIKSGDFGWFGNTPEDVKRNWRCEEPARLESWDTERNLTFKQMFGRRYTFFYPASYEYLQKKWVEENNLKVGDKIEVVRGWEEGENGYKTFYPDYDPLTKNFVLMVKAITNGCVVGETTNNFGTVSYDLPYFAIEKVKDEYRPFKDAEEFKDYREEWWEIDNIRQKAIFYGDRGVWFDGDFFEYETFFNNFRHADTGNPAGIKL